MSTRTIPEQRITVCDRCGAEAPVGGWGPGLWTSGEVLVHADSGGYGQPLDLCPRCAFGFVLWLRSDRAARERRAQP